jgi:hypothetical protein
MDKMAKKIPHDLSIQGIQFCPYRVMNTVSLPCMDMHFLSVICIWDSSAMDLDVEADNGSSSPAKNDHVEDTGTDEAEDEVVADAEGEEGVTLGDTAAAGNVNAEEETGVLNDERVEDAAGDGPESASGEEMASDAEGEEGVTAGDTAAAVHASAEGEAAMPLDEEETDMLLDDAADVDDTCQKGKEGATPGDDTTENAGGRGTATGESYNC